MTSIQPNTQPSIQASTHFQGRLPQGSLRPGSPSMGAHAISLESHDSLHFSGLFKKKDPKTDAPPKTPPKKPSLWQRFTDKRTMGFGITGGILGALAGIGFSVLTGMTGIGLLFLHIAVPLAIAAGVGLGGLLGILYGALTHKNKSAESIKPMNPEEQTKTNPLDSAPGTSGTQGTPSPDTPTNVPISTSTATPSTGVDPKALLKIFNIDYDCGVYTTKAQPQMGISASMAAEKISKAKTLVVGDLHGSYIKLLETLVMGDLITMPEGVANAIHQTNKALIQTLAKDEDLHSPSTRDEVKQQMKHLQGLFTEIQWKDDQRKLILMGDILADRGPVDTLTLDLLQHLTQGNPNRIETYIGNHDDHGFTYLFTRKTREAKINAGEANASKYGAAIEYPEQFGSLTRAMALSDDLNALDQQYLWFLDRSKIMDYDPKTSALKVHARIQEDHLKDFFKAYTSGSNPILQWTGPKDANGNIDFSKLNEDQLGKLCNFMNKAYRALIHHVHKTQQTEVFHQFYFIHDKGWLWSREAYGESDYPASHVAQIMIHGHDSDLSSNRLQYGNQGQGSITLDKIENAAKGFNQTHGKLIVNLDQQVRKGVRDHQWKGRTQDTSPVSMSWNNHKLFILE